MSAAPAEEVTRSRVAQARIAPLQWRVFLLCGCVYVLDGFVSQLAAFMSPAIGREWALSPPQITAILSAGLGGAALGGGLFGWLGDVWGRRTLILLSVACFGALTLCVVLVQDVTQLVALRFVTGIALGLAIPNVMSLVSEYAPPSRRGLIMNAAFCGIPVGGMVGGMLCAAIVGDFGWRSCFALAGALSLLLLPIAWRLLPESASFLLYRGRAVEARALLMQLGSEVEAALLPTASARLPVRVLFSRQYIVGVLVLCIMTFSMLTVLNFLLGWLPWILSGAGFGLGTAVYGNVTLNIGAIGGALIVGRLMDRYPRHLPIVAFALIGASAIATVAHVLANQSLTLAVILIMGAGLVGASFGVNSLAAMFFPPSLRATGLGVTYFSSHLGSFFGPIYGGALLASGLLTHGVFAFGAAPAVLAAVGATFLFVRARRAGRAVA